MPISPTGVVSYNANFFANGLVAGFDINQSGYSESVSALQSARPVPWAQGTYKVIIQVAGLQPITRTYQITLYSEQDYGALRSLVGVGGTLTTPREGSPSPGQYQSAVLIGLKRGSFQYSAWPHPGDGRDLQTATVDFYMFA